MMAYENHDLKNTNTSKNYLIGIFLIINSCIFIGASFIIKKKALIKSNFQGSKRASLGGYSYLKQWIWWCGLISMGIGELFNFIAYMFAPASFVTPLGGLSILVTAVLSNKFLNEKLSVVSKLGCILCITGSIMIILHAPKEDEISKLSQLGSMMMSSLFIFYIILVFIFSLVLIIYISPKYGNRYVIVYILICSLIGSLSVMSIKGIGIALAQAWSGSYNDVKNVLFYFLIILVIFSVSIQMNYLNKALDIFDTFIVTPIYYVFFTSFVLIASAILFQEWKEMNFSDFLGILAGFVTVVIAIFMLNFFKEQDVNYTKLKYNLTNQKYESTTNFEI